MNGKWEEDETAIGVDVRGDTEGEIMTCWVGIERIWMVDEMGTLVEREIIRGVKGEVESKTSKS